MQAEAVVMVATVPRVLRAAASLVSTWLLAPKPMYSDAVTIGLPTLKTSQLYYHAT